MTFSEFFWACNTWQKVRVVNSTHKLTFHRWCQTNNSELYDLSSDPDSLHNLASASSTQVAELSRIASFLGNCTGADCHRHFQASTLPDSGVRIVHTNAAAFEGRKFAQSL